MGDRIMHREAHWEGRHARGIFQIEPSSLPAPSSGTLEQLWDADTTTGPTFASAPTIEFNYPMTWFFDMVRFYADRLCRYYVQAWNGSAWINVAGSAAARHQASGANGRSRGLTTTKWWQRTS